MRHSLSTTRLHHFSHENPPVATTSSASHFHQSLPLPLPSHDMTLSSLQLIQDIFHPPYTRPYLPVRLRPDFERGDRMAGWLVMLGPRDGPGPGETRAGADGPCILNSSCLPLPPRDGGIVRELSAVGGMTSWQIDTLCRCVMHFRALTVVCKWT